MKRLFIMQMLDLFEQQGFTNVETLLNLMCDYFDSSVLSEFLGHCKDEMRL